MEETFTYKQIQDAWVLYSNTKVFRVLREGKWVVLPLKGAQNIDGTRAEVVPVKSVMSFPKYLRAKYGS